MLGAVAQPAQAHPNTMADFTMAAALWYAYNPAFAQPNPNSNYPVNCSWVNNGIDWTGVIAQCSHQRWGSNAIGPFTNFWENGSPSNYGWCVTNIAVIHGSDHSWSFQRQIHNCSA
jgi:hypothetical protein